MNIVIIFVNNLHINYFTQSMTTSCTCYEHYVGDGITCFHERGRCRFENGGCDVNARCSPANVMGMMLNDSAIIMW